MSKYIVFYFHTSYSQEKALFEYKDSNYVEEQAEAFLYYDNAFCDRVFIDSWRYATDEESAEMEKFLNAGYDFWAAQQEVCYPNHNSVNEIIISLANHGRDTRLVKKVEISLKKGEEVTPEELEQYKKILAARKEIM